MIASLPSNEMERLDILRQCGILDTPPEPAFDDITNLAASLCDAPMAAVTLIDSERQWLKSAVGLETGESSRETAFCAHTILEPVMTIIPDAQTDIRFADNPLVTGTPHIRFYAGAPLITSDGYALGALCIVDSAPRQLTPEQETTLRILSRQITAHLELRRYTRTQRRMLDERTKMLGELHESQKLLQDYAIALETNLAELERANGELEKANLRLEALATEDGLTGLKNHRTFQERLAEACVQTGRYGTALSLILLDVDNFKTYNDTFGHPAGDDVLRDVARILQSGARETDVVARYGGEEFALLLPSIDTAGAVALAERLRHDVESHPWTKRPVTISLGVSSWSPGNGTAKQLLQSADNRLYEAKKGGRNRVAANR